MEKTEKAKDRVEVLAKIEEYERQGWFDKDVEDDPPFARFKTGEVDFLKKKLSSKIKRQAAYTAGRIFFDGMMRKKQIVFKGVTGLENLKGISGGAIVTCNHFNVFDNYAVRLAIRKHSKKITLHKFVREGNYALPGKIGFIMRHCDTLPLCQDMRAMTECLNAAKAILKRGDMILIYPEQAMWWNYRKPRPLKNGAFKVAAQNKVPVIPCFITLNDSGIIGPDGFPVQEYTVHILPSIYPDDTLSVPENCETMKEKNFALWKEVYERLYNKRLVYGKDAD